MYNRHLQREVRLYGPLKSVLPCVDQEMVITTRLVEPTEFGVFHDSLSEYGGEGIETVIFLVVRIGYPR